jgi:hypothetical protein
MKFRLISLIDDYEIQVVKAIFEIKRTQLIWAGMENESVLPFDRRQQSLASLLFHGSTINRTSKLSSLPVTGLTMRMLGFTPSARACMFRKLLRNRGLGEIARGYE